MQSRLLAKYLLEKAQARDSKYHSMPALQPCGLKTNEPGEPPYKASSSSLPRKKKHGAPGEGKEKEKKRPSSAQPQRSQPLQQQQQQQQPSTVTQRLHQNTGQQQQTDHQQQQECQNVKVQREREKHQERQLQPEREKHQERQLQQEREKHRERQMQQEREKHQERQKLQEREKHQERQKQQERENHEQERQKQQQQGPQKQQQQRPSVLLRHSKTEPQVRRVYEQAMPAPGISVTVQQEKFRLSFPPQGNKHLEQLHREQQEAASSAPVINKEHYVPVFIQPHATTLQPMKGHQMTSFSPPPVSQGSTSPQLQTILAATSGYYHHQHSTSPGISPQLHHYQQQGNPHSQAIFQFPPRELPQTQGNPHQHHHHHHHPARVSGEDPMYDSGLCMCPPGATTHTDGTPVHPEWTEPNTGDPAVKQSFPAPPSPLSPKNVILPQLGSNHEATYVSGDCRRNFKESMGYLFTTFDGGRGFDLIFFRRGRIEARVLFFLLEIFDFPGFNDRQFKRGKKLKRLSVSGNVRISWRQKVLNPDGTTGVGSPGFT